MKFLLFPMGILLFLSGCASVPTQNVQVIATDKPLEQTSNEQWRTQQRYLNRELIASTKSMALPAARLSLPEANKQITPQQLELISNTLNRSLCRRLGEYLEIKPFAGEQDMQLSLALTGIRATSRSAAGISAAAGVFVPGPFRIPVGMGAIGLDAKASRSDQTIAFVRWAKGANPVINSGAISTISDAYELVDTFAKEFTALLFEDDTGRLLRPKLAANAIDANERLCIARFGKTNVVGKGVSFVLPIAPELLDSGKPKAEEGSTESE
jgi:hypothetical protein